MTDDPDDLDDFEDHADLDDDYFDAVEMSDLDEITDDDWAIESDAYFGDSIGETYDLPVEGLIGSDDPGGWHWQEADDTCAIAAQEFVLEDLTGRSLEEGQLVDIAEANGWYEPGGGTALSDVGRVAEAFGVPVERSVDVSIFDIAEHLQAGRHVIVGLDSDEIATGGIYGTAEDLVGDFPGIPGQGADHAVQVIGIRDLGSPDGVVIVNDPGRIDGASLEIPIEQFRAAHDDTNNFAAIMGSGATGSAGDLGNLGTVSLGGNTWASSDGYSYDNSGYRVDYHGTGGGYSYEL